MNVKSLKTIKESISLHNSKSLSNIATGLILLQATLTMGKSTAILNMNRIILKYGKFHLYATPKIPLTRRNINSKRIFDSYCAMWNTVIRDIDHYVRQHTAFRFLPQTKTSPKLSSPMNKYGTTMCQDANFIIDCTSNQMNLFEIILNKLKSIKLFKTFGDIIKSNNRKSLYGFDLKIDTPDASKLKCNNDKLLNVSLFKNRKYRKVIYRPYNKRKYSRIMKRRLKIPKNILTSSQTPLNKNNQILDDFSSIITDNTPSEKFPRTYDRDAHEIKKQLKTLTTLESTFNGRIIDKMKPMRTECHSPSVTTIIRNNFAVHSYISDPINIFDVQILGKSKYNPSKYRVDIEHKNKFNLNLYNNCINLRPINNAISTKRYLSNISESPTFLSRKKLLNSTRFASTIKNKNTTLLKKSPIMDKYMFITDTELRNPNQPKLCHLVQENQLNDYIKYDDSMLMSSSNERQFTTLMSKIKNRINYNDEMEKLRLNAMSKQLEQIRNIKKVLNLYSDDENFKTNIQYQPGEPKYELNCALSKYMRPTSARTITKLQDEVKEQFTPPQTPRRQSLLRLPKTVNGNIGTSRLIQELNSTATRMFQSSLKNMHSVTYNNQNYTGKTRFGGNVLPQTSTKSTLDEYNQSSMDLIDTNKLFTNNNLIFPKKIATKENDKKHAVKYTHKPVDERTKYSKTANENIVSNHHDSKNMPAENVPNANTSAIQYEQFYKNHLNYFDSMHPNASKSPSQKFDQTTQKNITSEVKSNILPVKTTTKQTITKSNKSEEKNVPTKISNNFMVPQYTPSLNSQCNDMYATGKFDERNTSAKSTINTRQNEKNQDLKQASTIGKNQESKQNNKNAKSTIKESISKANKNVGTEPKEKLQIKQVRRSMDAKPLISYAINVNKTAMVKEHSEKYSKRRLNMLSDKKRTEMTKKSDKQTTNTVQETLPPTSINRKASNEYKMNISPTPNENTIGKQTMPRAETKKSTITKQFSKALSTSSKVLKSASIIASNVKRSDDIKLASSFNLPHAFRMNILDASKNKSNSMLHADFLLDETPKLFGNTSPNFLDMHNIEKNVNKSREEMQTTVKETQTNVNKTNKRTEPKKFVIDDHVDTVIGYSKTASVPKNSTGVTQFTVSSTSPYVSKLIDIPESMYSPLITRKVNKVGAITVKKYHHNKEPRYAINKNRNINNMQFKPNARQFMTNAGRLRGGEDRINSALERLLIRAHFLSKNLQTIRYQYQEYVEQLEKFNFENMSPKMECSCDSIQCTCNGLNFNQDVNTKNNKLNSSPAKKHISRSTLRKCDYDFQNPCMDGPFSDILARHFLPGNKGKMPAIVGYKADGTPIYGPPGAAYNVMGWTRDGSPIFGRGGPGSKEPLVNIRAYNKATPLYEPSDPAEQTKITLIGTYDNAPITGHRDLINGMIFIGKGDKGFGKYKVFTKLQKSLNTNQNNNIITPTLSESESINSEEMKRALNSFISNEPPKSIAGPEFTTPTSNKSKTEKEKLISIPLSYSIGNIRCNKYHEKCISPKHRVCSIPMYKPIIQKRKTHKTQSLKKASKNQWMHKPGEIMKPVAKTIRMHRRRLGLKNPERLLKKLENKKNK